MTARRLQALRPAHAMQRATRMAQTVSDQIIQRLYAWGVRRIYGYPGDGINGLIGALDRADGRIRFIQTRHEEIAAFMACAHAKFTGEVGVCMATSGPGAIHLLNGLYDAQMRSSAGRRDRRPDRDAPRWAADYQQEVDLQSLFKDVAHNYVHECDHPAAARHQIDRAMRIAFAERCVTVRDRAERRAGAGRGRDAAARAQHARERHRLSPRRRRARRRRSSRRRRDPQRRRARRDARRRGRARREPTRCSRSPTCSAPASRRRCSARRSSPTSCRS